MRSTRLACLTATTLLLLACNDQKECGNIECVSGLQWHLAVPVRNFGSDAVTYKSCRNDDCVSSARGIVLGERFAYLGSRAGTRVSVQVEEYGLERSIIELDWDIPAALARPGDVYSFTIEAESGEPLLETSTTVQSYKENYPNGRSCDRELCLYMFVDER